MNRRHFLMAGSATAAASMIRINPALAAESATNLYAKGLIMISFEDSKVLRLGFPKAPGHKATLSLVPQTGGQRTMNLKGPGVLEPTMSAASGRREFKIPELIRMQELYGSGIRSRVAECPIVLSLPYTSINSISTSEVSPSRYTFVRADNGQEVHTFRPRQVAETLKIELLSDGVLKLDGGKASIALNTMKEIHAEYSPEAVPNSTNNVDAFAAHFPHYFDYLDRPATANFDVVPKKLGGSSSVTPRVGNNFAMFWPYIACFVVGV
jgi:hypothetical protein